MRAAVSVGYRLPQDSRVVAGAWMILSGGDTEELANPDVLPSWDYFTDVRARRDLQVDVDGVLDDCGLPSDAQLGVVLTWHSTNTNLRGHTEPFTVESPAISVTTYLNGDELGGRLTLGTRLVLLEDLARNPGSPSHAGTVLWADERRLTLEGTGARFPTMHLDFADAGVGGGRAGAWALLCDSNDLDASALGSLRLLINTGHERMAEVLANPTTPDAVTVAAMLQFDVCRQLVFLGLSDEDFDLSVRYEEGTLGAAYASLIRRLYPGRAIDELRGELRLSRGDFEADLQGRAGFLR